MKHGKYAGLVNGTPEFRAANAAAKREARAAKRKAAAKIDFWSWSDEFYASPDCALVRQEQELFKKQVEQELGRTLPPAHFFETQTIEHVAYLSACLDRSVTKNTEEGFCIGSQFADVLGHDLILNTHRFSLEVSDTYRKAYRHLLVWLDEKFGGNTAATPNSPEHRSAVAIKLELAGRFTLPGGCSADAPLHGMTTQK